MPFINSMYDDARLFYRDYLPATSPPPFRPSLTATEHAIKPALVFSHGWPMSSAMYTHLTVPLCETHRYRIIAPDRRGFGSSEWNGDAGKDVSYNVFAQDLIQIVKTSGATKGQGWVGIGSSMGCGELVLALALDSELRASCKGLVFMGPAVPYPVQTEANPKAPSKEVWEGLLDAIREDREGFVRASVPNVFGAHAGVEISETSKQRFELIIGQADGVAVERCVQIFINKNLTAEVESIGKAGFPILILHGDSDNSFPVEAGPQLIKDAIPRTEIVVYEKAAHGLYLTHKEQVMKDLLTFLGKAETHDGIARQVEQK